LGEKGGGFVTVWWRQARHRDQADDRLTGRPDSGEELAGLSEESQADIRKKA